MQRAEGRGMAELMNVWMKVAHPTLKMVDTYSGIIWWPICEMHTKEEVSKLRDGLFMDVGANVGYYSIMAAENGTLS